MGEIKIEVGRNSVSSQEVEKKLAELKQRLEEQEKMPTCYAMEKTRADVKHHKDLLNIIASKKQSINDEYEMKAIGYEIIKSIIHLYDDKK